MSNLRLIGPFLRLCFSRNSAVKKNLYHFTKNTLCQDHVIKRYGLTNGLPTVDLLDLFPGFSERVEHYSYLDGTSRPTDIALLKLLARRFTGGRYIEFGTWRGESIANVAPFMQEAVAISFSKEEMRRIGTPEPAVRASHFFSKTAPNVTFIEHNTQTFDFSAHEKKYDLVFVDADHQYEGVTIDTRNAFRLLKDEKSIIVWHDYGKGYESVDWQVFRGILDGAPSDAHRKKIYHVSNTLCAIYTNEPLKTNYPEIAMPNKAFTVDLSASRT